MRAFVEFRHMAATLSLPSSNADVAQLRKDFEDRFCRTWRDEGVQPSPV